MPAAGISRSCIGFGVSVIHVSKADVATGEENELMLIEATADALPMLLESTAMDEPLRRGTL